MSNTFNTKEELFSFLTDIDASLEDDISLIPQDTWNTLFPGSTEEFDFFICKVKEKRAENERIKEACGHIIDVVFNPPFTTVFWENGEICFPMGFLCAKFNKQRMSYHGR